MKSTWSSNPFFLYWRHEVPQRWEREEKKKLPVSGREHVSALAKLSMLIRFSRPFSTQLLAVSRCRQSWLDLSRDENGRTRTNREKQLFLQSRSKAFFVLLFMCVLFIPSTLCSYGATHDDIVKSISQKRSKAVTKKSRRQRKELWDNRLQTSENLEKLSNEVFWSEKRNKKNKSWEKVSSRYLERTKEKQENIKQNLDSQ